MKTYTQPKIQKDTRVKLEVWDKDNFLNGGDDLMLKNEGTVDSFLDHTRTVYKSSYVEWTSTWKDE